jgi:hypothetical protein
MTDSRPGTNGDPIDASCLTEELSRRIGAWIAAQPEPRPTRSEAIRRLLSEALGKTADARQDGAQAIGDEAALPELPPNVEPYDGSPM